MSGGRRLRRNLKAGQRGRLKLLVQVVAVLAVLALVVTVMSMSDVPPVGGTCRQLRC